MQLLQQEARVFTRSASGPHRSEDASVAPRVRSPAAPLLASLAEADLHKRTTTTTLRTTTTPMTLVYNDLTYNASGDLPAFLSGLLTNCLMIVGCIIAFMVLRVHYPLKYSFQVLQGLAPSKPDVMSHFSWIKASLNIDLDQHHIEHIGLDRSLLLEFSRFGMRVCMVIGVPLVFITCPLHYFCGGHVAGADRLSYFSIGNVQNGSWLYYVEAMITWATVITVCRMMILAQRRFISLRWSWMRTMAPLRANTVLVEGIPEEFQSDEELKKFFETMFPGDKIKSTHCVKDTSALSVLLHKISEAEAKLHEVKILNEKDPAHPQTFRSGCFGAAIDAEEHYSRIVEELRPQADTLRKTIVEASSKPGLEGYNCTTGFVTFHQRSDAELATRLTNISSDMTEWRIDHPPEPSDILWVDLMQDPTAEEGRKWTGYLLIVGLYFAYMPLVIGITNVAKVVDLGPLQPLWASIAPTLGLTIMVDFLPTFIIAIFKMFFTLKAEAWAQLRLQEMYFWFQIVFVVLATAVGQNTRDFTKSLATDPFSIFETLGNSMPYATHFYMNYIVMQWSTHCMNLLRYVNLAKFKMFCAFYSEEEAAVKSEPEDQDYYGMGSRHARWTTNLVIALVFGTICPWMYLLTLINFAVCRLVYGYLIPFAETRKPDLGGPFWVTALRHTHHGLMIYVILMIGVLWIRGPNIVPSVVVIPALAYVFFSLKYFDEHLAWEKLPFHEMMTKEGKALDAATTKRELSAEYVQTELLQPSEVASS